MNTDQLAEMPKDLNLERLVAACLAINADPHAVIALALTEGMREQADCSGMTMKAQADLAWKLVDKANPSQTSVKHSGDKQNPVAVVFSKDDENL